MSDPDPPMTPFRDPSPSPFQDAIEDIRVDGDGAILAGGIQHGKPVAGAQASKTLPHHTFFGARWQWAKDVGHSALVFVGWRPRGRSEG